MLQFKTEKLTDRVTRIYEMCIRDRYIWYLKKIKKI